MAFTGWDRNYEIACNIIQTFDKHYPSPLAKVVADSIILASEISGELEMDKIIEWAKDYAEKWQEEHVK